MPHRSPDPADLFPPPQLLELAQQAGNLGIFEWYVPTDYVRLSPNLLAMQEVDAFEGGFDSWLDLLFREDRVRIAHLMRAAIADRVPNLHAEYRISNKNSDTVKWVEGRFQLLYGE